MPTLTRSFYLLGDAEVCDVYVDAVKQIENLGFYSSKYQIMVALQPDHPEAVQDCVRASTNAELDFHPLRFC